MVIIETPLFTGQMTALLGDDIYAAFQLKLIRRPDTGDLVKGGGGIRKARVQLPGRGKSGGARVIYVWLPGSARIYMLVAYAKNRRSDLTAGQLKQLRVLVKELT